MTTKRKRTPDGVDFKRPIALRLKPEERESAETISISMGLTKSALARQAYLAGLPIVLNSQPNNQ